MFKKGHLYFHSPCFDGITSAVLTFDFLHSKRNWFSIMLHTVNYNLRENWLSLTLKKPCAVVDFLYHPQADYWADHHLTTFLNEDARKDFELRNNQNLVYDKNADSCARLLENHLKRVFSYWNPKYDDLVNWADKIDSARYESAEEAIFPSAPAIKISLSLVFGNRGNYCERLVHSFRHNTISRIAEFDWVKKRVESAQALIQKGLDRFKRVAHREKDGIVVFDVESREAIISRYAPYYFFPEARYSAGIVRLKGRAKIIVMRNPLREFKSVSIGEICEKFGGGGHQRIGAINIRNEHEVEAGLLLDRILNEIRIKDKEISRNQK